MKCPLFIMNDTRAQLGEETEIGDCIKEECAWWISDINMCAIRDIALELQHTQFRLADLVKIINERGRK